MPTCPACDGAGSLVGDTCPLCGSGPELPESAGDSATGPTLSEQTAPLSSAALAVYGSEPMRRPTRSVEVTIFLPMKVEQEPMTAAEAAKVGTSWSNEDFEIPPNLLSPPNASATFPEPKYLPGMCGICHDPFRYGGEVTALPCVAEGCNSVWHQDCIRSWLCNGSGCPPSCPLCRAKIEPGAGSRDDSGSGVVAVGVRTTFQVTMTGDDDGASARTQEILRQFLFHALLSSGGP